MIANHSLKLFFSLKEMGPAIKVAEQIVQYVPSTCVSPKADTVLFNYNVGRIYIHFHRFAEADESLSKAFDQCLKDSFQNKQRILMYLVVTRMIRGKIPTDQLLQKYGLHNSFSKLVTHYKTGNMAGFLMELEAKKEFMLKHGFYLIMLHRTQILLYRNLFSRMYLVDDATLTL